MAQESCERVKPTDTGAKLSKQSAAFIEGLPCHVFRSYPERPNQLEQPSLNHALPIIHRILLIVAISWRDGAHVMPFSLEVSRGLWAADWVIVIVRKDRQSRGYEVTESDTGLTLYRDIVSTLPIVHHQSPMKQLTREKAMVKAKQNGLAYSSAPESWRWGFGHAST
ncbi:12037_t:CDS:2, partial [Acaulospora colombiana]